MTDSAQLQKDLARVALGDRAAFARVYQATSAHLFGVALRILNRRDVTKPPGSTSFEISATSEKLLSNVTRLAVSFEDAPARAGATPGDSVLIGPCLKLW